MTRTSTRFFLALLLSVCLSACAAATASAQAVTILHSFGDGSVVDDGHIPYAALVEGRDGSLYGTTYEGGTGAGTAFKITPSGKYTLLHSFSDGSVPDDGYYPYAALVEGRDGNLYGTTFFGGTGGEGTVFKMTPSGTVTILHSFQNDATPDDGINPVAALVEGRDGNLYGTTFYNAAVFKITPAGTYTVLHRFGDGSVLHDGADPAAALVLGRDGNFYGTTEVGGVGEGYGTVFKMTPSGTETILHWFGDGSVPDDGLNPLSPLIEGNDGNFYGTTSTGGITGGPTGLGTVFRITPSGTETILHRFGDGSVPSDGAYPQAALVKGWDGDFYGTTEGGGSTTSVYNSYGYGTIFKITHSGTVTILHNFHDGSVADDGAFPTAALIRLHDRGFFGTTYSGGTAGTGTVFRLSRERMRLPRQSRANAAIQNNP